MATWEEISKVWTKKDTPLNVPLHLNALVSALRVQKGQPFEVLKTRIEDALTIISLT